MICSNYDAFTLEEDGRIESQVTGEYRELNLSNPPTFIWANSSEEARRVIDTDSEIDMIMCMYNDRDKGIFDFAAELKKNGSNIPFIMLIHYSKAVRQRLFEHDRSGIDFVFSWHGNADLILAIVKLIEDSANAENDVFEVGVRVILLVEDSVRYYSTYLPELYKLLITQSREFLTEFLNEGQRKYRKRSRPKILLATCYDDALAEYSKVGAKQAGVMGGNLLELAKMEQDSAVALKAKTDASVLATIRNILLLSVFILLVISLVCFFTMRQITTPLSVILSACKKMEQGDFRLEDIPMERKDEFGELLLHIVSQLHEKGP